MYLTANHSSLCRTTSKKGQKCMYYYYYYFIYFFFFFLLFYWQNKPFILVAKWTKNCIIKKQNKIQLFQPGRYYNIVSSGIWICAKLGILQWLTASQWIIGSTDSFKTLIHSGMNKWLSLWMNHWIILSNNLFKTLNELAAFISESLKYSFNRFLQNTHSGTMIESLIQLIGSNH